MAQIKSKFAKTISVLLAAAVISSATLAGAPLAARADDLGLIITETSGSGGYSQDSDGNITITENGSYKITGNGTSTGSTVSVYNKCTATITIENVDIEPNTSSCAFEINDYSTVNLILVGKNILDTANGDAGRAGLAVDYDYKTSEVNTVNISGTGSLTATGGTCSAGIGGNNYDGCGNINISGGTITAIGNLGSAGIGSASSGQPGNISISGGYVKATGGSGAAGIDGTVNITGGTVIAQGGDYGAGIGGANSGTNGTINISNASVTAKGGENSAGIGGGGGKSCKGGDGGTITISGAGTVVSATGANGGADIGSGNDNTNGGSLTVGKAGETTGPLPTVSLENAGTDAITPSFKNCVITGSGADANAGVYGENGRIAVPLDVSQGDITIGNNTLTAKDSSGTTVSPNSSNNYVIKGTTTGHVVLIKDCTAFITLDKVDIKNTGCIFKLDNATVTISLIGSSTLDASAGSSGTSGDCAGLSVDTGSTVNICGTGLLTAQGGAGGAGIGGNATVSDENCGNVNISGGCTVTANGSAGGAGIGGGKGGSGGTVSISDTGTSVSATGSGGGEDIGSGDSSTVGGSLTVGSASDSLSPLPELKLANQTNAATTYLNCEIDIGNSSNTYYAINYYLDGGTNSQAPVSYIQGAVTTIGSPTKADYTFEGWYTDAQFTNPISSIGAAQSGVITLYAKWLSSDTSLSDLSLSTGQLDPDFSPSTFNYTASVGNDIKSITVKAAAKNAYASFKVNDTVTANNTPSVSIPLKVGDNYITVKVTAQDGKTNDDYTIRVTRVASDTSLSTLSLSSGKLSPDFSPDTLNYTAGVGNDVTGVTVTASVSNANASFKVNNKAGVNNTASDSIPLIVGDNTINITVTAQDGATGTYTIIVTREAARSSGGTGTTMPQPVNVTGTPVTNADGTTTTAASIPLSDLGSGTSTVTATLGAVSVTAPADVLSSALGSGANLTLSQSPSPAATQSALFKLVTANGDIPIASLDLNLNASAANGTITAVHNLSGNVTVAITLTKEQIALLHGAEPDIYYYDTGTNPASLVDMHAAFNTSTGALSFTTNHFSTWLIKAAGNVPVAYTPDISCTAHVQDIGWQGDVFNGALCGTTGRALRMEALSLKLTGSIPAGAGIIYQAHVQNIGWQNAAADGTLAGTTGRSLRMEALRVTLKGLTGYAVKYRAFVQNKGWLDWQQTANGTDITNAAIAGTSGKSLRMEAVEIEIVKVS